MKFARQTYRGRPTKWQYINRFYEYKREGWKTLREIETRMFLEGRLSVTEYMENLNIETCEAWKWVQMKLDQANTKKDPTSALNQIDIYKLGDCVDEIDEEFKRISLQVMVLETCPLEECPGYVFNKKFNVSLEERQAIVANPNAVLSE